MYKYFILLIIYLLIKLNNGIDYLPTLSAKCNNSEYFNFETLSCDFCDPNLSLIPNINTQQCECNTKKYNDPFPIVKNAKCISCSENELYSKDLKRCLKCHNGISKISNNFACKPCRPNEIILTYTRNGTALKESICLPCENGMVPSEDKTACVPCPILNPVVTNGTVKCSCDYKSVLLDNVCVSTDIFPELSNDKRNFYLQYNSKKQVKSDLFEKYLKKNIYLCKLKNVTACQFLANMCALTLFSNYENSPCGLWLESRYSVNTENSKNLPWLFYKEGEGKRILEDSNITMKYSLDPDLMESMLNFTGVIFKLDGTLKEITAIEGKDLNLCPGSNIEKNKSFRFGINFEYSCQVDAQQFFGVAETEFVVPYLQFWDEKSSLVYPVPVLIKNIGHNTGEDPSSWLLVRRFFMIDKISSFYNNKSSAFQYVKSVEINVEVQNEERIGQILPPLLILEYAEITQEEYDTGKMIDFSFSIRFHLPNSMAHSIEISISVLTVFAAIYSGLQTWVYYRRTGRYTIDLMLLLRLCLFACGNLANAFFIVAFGTSVYTFIFYKGQNVIHVLLPSLQNETTIKIYIIVAFSLKIVEIISLIWSQINVDIFLIDWERPKPQDSIPRPNTSPRNSEESVSVWRSLFIANEWNEIQTTRKINLVLHLVVLTFFLEVLGFQYWGTVDTELHTSVPEHLSKTPFNFICRFAVGALLFISLYILQILFAVAFYERYIKNAIQEFVDICSLANISLFIMSLERYGFYIHGRSSHGFADTDMSTMIKQLKREEEDLCGYRGLLPGTYQQTFIVGIPAKLRLYYNKLMTLTINISTTGYANESSYPNSPRDNLKMSAVDRMVKAYHNINKFFCAFLEHALKDLDYDVKDKLFVEKLLDIEFTDSYHRGVLYTDNGHSFDNVLFYGNEFTLFTFDLMLFSFVLAITDNFILCILVTISFAEVLKIIRKIGGKRNLARKTLIDQRFLI